MTADGTLAAAATPRPASFRLKGGLFPLTVLELASYSSQAFEADLKSKVAEAPAFFQQAPVVLSLESFAGELQTPALGELCRLCRYYGLIPIALRGGSDCLQQQALELGLALMAESRNKTVVAATTTAIKSATPETSDFTQPAVENSAEHRHCDHQQRLETPATAEGRPEAAKPRDEPRKKASGTAATEPEQTCLALEPEPNNTPSAPESRGSKIVTTPIRSGQQVYAAGGDLIVMAAVSAGAEILADGNIHVYGPLRGRALAGVRGDTSARVFCYSLEAELISIAGHFKLDEDLRSGHWKQPVQVRLDDLALLIEPLLTRSSTN